MAVAVEPLISVRVPFIVEPIPDDPPLKPVPEGKVHVYIVPFGTNPSAPFIGDIVKFTPLHEEKFILFMSGVGFT